MYLLEKLKFKLLNNSPHPIWWTTRLFCVSGTTSLVQNLLAYPGLGHSGPLDVEGGGGSSGGECPASASFTSGGGVIGGTQMSSLPPAMRVRLYELFVQIEREFEILYAENLNLQVHICTFYIVPNLCVYLVIFHISYLPSAKDKCIWFAAAANGKISSPYFGQKIEHENWKSDCYPKSQNYFITFIKKNLPYLCKKWWFRKAKIFAVYCHLRICRRQTAIVHV